MATPRRPSAPGNWYYDGSANRWIDRKTGRADLSAGRPGPPRGNGDNPADVDRPLTARIEAVRLQTFLKNRGYNLLLDGVIGERTKSAIADWHRGVGLRNPGQWSQKVAPVDEVRPGVKTRNNQPPATRTPPKQVPKGTPKLGVDYGRNSFYQPVVGTQKPVLTGKGRPNLPGVAVSNVPGGQESFDVDVLANAQMEAKYGPVLAEYLRQEKNIRNMADNRVAEIGDMYGTYVGDIKNRNIEAANLRGTMAAATAGLTPAIAQGIALDPAAAAELANRGDIESDYAAQMNQSAGDFDRRLAGAAQAGGVFAAGQERAEMSGKIGKLGAERKDTLAQRGADLVATRQALEEWQADQYFKRQELDLNRQSAQASIADASTKNAIALAELKAANAMLPLEAQKTQAELERLYADIAYTNAQTMDIMNPRSSPSDIRQGNQDAADKKARTDALRINTLNAMTTGTRFGESGDGRWRLPMNKNWAKAKAILNSMGVDPKSPTGKKWLRLYANQNGIILGEGGNPVRRRSYAPRTATR